MDSEAQDHHFRTEHLNVGMGARMARGGVVTFASQGLRFGLSIGVTMVLARLLTKEDYGLIGMIAVFISFASLFKDLGLSTATIQREGINFEQVSTLFWVNVGVSAGLALAFAASAPAIARFYAEPRLTAVGIVTSLGFVLGGFGVQHESLLRRQMRFTVLGIIEVGALVTGAAVAIFFAWRGFGYWALVFSQLAAASATTLGVWLACNWRPGPPVRYSGVRSMLKFGGNFTGVGILNYAARNADNMLIGRFWGAAQLGIYSRAYQLLLLPIDQINSPIAAVAVPALSRMTESPDRYRDAYLRMLEKVAMITMPGLAFMIVCSDWIVQIVLGPKWAEVSRIFRWLGIVGLVQPIANTTGWLFISQNRAHHMLQMALVTGPLTVLAFVVGLPHGGVGVAAAYSMLGVCFAPVIFWWVGKTGPVRTRDIYRTIAPSVFATLAAGTAAYIFRQSSGIASPIAGVASTLLVFGAIVLMVLWTIPAGRRAIEDFKPLLLVLTQRRKPA